MGKYLLMILLITVLAGCSQVPGDIIQPDEMAALLSDMEMGESVVANEPQRYGNDSLRMVLQQSIYRKHGVTTEQVDTSLAWYGANIEQYAKVYDRVIEIIEQRTKEAREAGLAKGVTAHDQATADGDSVDVWPLEPRLRFDINSAASLVKFALTRDRNFEPGDAYELSFKTISGTASKHAVIAAEYVDGTTDYIPLETSSTGWHHLTLPLDSATLVKSIYGGIGIDIRGNAPVYIDSISLVRMRNKHGRRLRSTRKYHLNR